MGRKHGLAHPHLKPEVKANKATTLSFQFHFRFHCDLKFSPNRIDITNPSREIKLIAMDAAARRVGGGGGGGLFEGIYRVIMRRNSVYVTFVILGAFAGERVVDYGVHKLWEMNNVGKRYEDIPVLGQRQSEE
ncbi:Cytochrome b-c1 complex subunit 9, mitochondrial-like protein [Drosera capensis]